VNGHRSGFLALEGEAFGRRYLFALPWFGCGAFSGVALYCVGHGVSSWESLPVSEGWMLRWRENSNFALWQSHFFYHYWDSEHKK